MHLCAEISAPPRVSLQGKEEDAPRAPHVDFGPIHGRAEEQLGRLVPLRDDAVRVVVPTSRGVEAREAKVGNLELAVLGEEDVGPLEVAVEDAALVDEREAVEELLHERLEVRGREVDRRVVQHAGEVVIRVLEDHVHVACFPCQWWLRGRRRERGPHPWTPSSRASRQRSDAGGTAAA